MYDSEYVMYNNEIYAGKEKCYEFIRLYSR